MGLASQCVRSLKASSILSYLFILFHFFFCCCDDGDYPFWQHNKYLSTWIKSLSKMVPPVSLFFFCRSLILNFQSPYVMNEIRVFAIWFIRLNFVRIAKHSMLFALWPNAIFSVFYFLPALISILLTHIFSFHWIH